MASKRSRGRKTKRRPNVIKVGRDARGHPQDNSNKDGDYPYLPGTLLKVDFCPEPLPGGGDLGPQAGAAAKVSTLTLAVIKTLSRTLSCVLLVSLSGQDIKAITSTSSSKINLEESKQELKAVLKLYDRRFSNGIREDYDATPWTPDIEEEWMTFEALDEDEKPEVCVDEEENNSWSYGSDANSSKTTNWTENTNGRKRILPSAWTPGHREAYMQKICDKIFDAEVSVYRHLQTLQGKMIPLVFGTVTLPTGVGDSKGKNKAKVVSGMLMEYIQPSFSLRGIPENVSDKSLWQDLGEMAVALVQDVGDYGVLDEDVRLDNILMVPVKDGYYSQKLGVEGEDEFGDNNERPGGLDGDKDSSMKSAGGRDLKFYRAVRIDFGLARVRRDDETDEDWRKARRFRDEEGAVGFVLEMHLRKAANANGDDRPFKFRHSHRLQSIEDLDEADI